MWVRLTVNSPLCLPPSFVQFVLVRLLQPDLVNIKLLLLMVRMRQSLVSLRQDLGGEHSL